MIPSAADRRITCCFTGHRDLTVSQIQSAASRVHDRAARLYELGYRRFICGGALGFDMVAATMINNMRLDYPGMALILALPCHDHAVYWKPDARGQLDTLMRFADDVIYVTDSGYRRGCMLKRDRYMVDRSSVLLAWHDGRTHGGTYYTVNYARSAGVAVRNIYNQ